MECDKCRNLIVTYIDGQIDTTGIRELKEHLKECDSCSGVFAELMSEKVFDMERQTAANPFLATRVMAAIETADNAMITPFHIFAIKIAKPLLIAASITIAIMLGILAGNIGNNNKLSGRLPSEMVYLNDANIESLETFMAN